MKAIDAYARAIDAQTAQRAMRPVYNHIRGEADKGNLSTTVSINWQDGLTRPQVICHLRLNGYDATDGNTSNEIVVDWSLEHSDDYGEYFQETVANEGSTL